MNELENPAFLGRMSRLRRLEGALRLAKACDDVARSRKDAPDLRDLLAAHKSVVAIIEFIDSSPDWEKEELSFALAILTMRKQRLLDWRTPEA